MTNQHVLPNEIVQHIVLYLDIQDVLKCHLVCKLWKEILSGEPFCKQYVLKWWDFVFEPNPSGYLQMWQDDWFCYWGDDAEVKVFMNNPKRWKNGIVHPSDFSIENEGIKYQHFLKAVVILDKLRKGGSDHKLDISAWANEGSSDVEVCMFPWDKEYLPDANDLVNIFHFNPIFHKYTMENSSRNYQKIRIDAEGYDDDDDYDDNHDDNDNDAAGDGKAKGKEDEEGTGAEGEDEGDGEGEGEDEGEDEADGEMEDEGEVDGNGDGDGEGLGEDEVGEVEKLQEENEEDEQEEYNTVSWAYISGYVPPRQTRATLAFFNWMRKVFQPFKQYCLGCDGMNPTPFFMLTHLSPGWVGGVISGLALT